MDGKIPWRERHAGRQAGWQAGRQAGKQASRQADAEPPRLNICHCGRLERRVRRQLEEFGQHEGELSLPLKVLQCLWVEVLRRLPCGRLQA